MGIFSVNRKRAPTLIRYGAKIIPVEKKNLSSAFREEIVRIARRTGERNVEPTRGSKLT